MSFAVLAVPPSNQVTIAFTDSSIDASNASTYTFSSQALGTAAADRVIVVGLFGDTARTVSSVTIGGVSASRVKRQLNTGNFVELWQAAVPTGTTGDVVITFSGACSRSGVGVWALYGANPTAHDTGASSANPGTDTLDVPALGVAIAYSAGSSIASWSWTGLTEKFDELLETDTYHAGASDAFSGTQTGMTVTATANTAPTQPALVMASWGPA